MRLQRLNPGNVVMAATQALSKAIHDGKNLILNSLTGHTITLPASAGTGATFRFFETVSPTSGSTVIKVQNSTDVMIGSLGVNVAAGTGADFPTAAASDTITLNRTTTGGASNGEYIEITDILAGFWEVQGQLNGSGAAATPFSSGV